MSNFRFTIGRRIGMGFVILMLIIIVIFSFTYSRVNESNSSFKESKQISEEITNVYDPSLKAIESLQEHVLISRTLIGVWVNRDVKRDDPSKTQLLRLKEDKIPGELETVLSYVDKWNDKKEEEIAAAVEQRIHSLLKNYHTITDSLLVEMDDYTEDSSDWYSIERMYADDMISAGGEMDVLAETIVGNLEDLAKRMDQNRRVAYAEKEAGYKKTTDAFNAMLWQIAFLGGLLIFGAIVVGIFTTRSIVRPVNQLKDMLNKMGRGIIPQSQLKPSNDEIGEMASALNRMVDGYRQTTEFSNQVGSGNFDYDYQPLSSEDSLGHALLKMRDDLAENERILEQKVVERTEEVVRQRDEIERQRHKLEELYKDVTDSIRYAKRLQDSILPPERYIEELLPNSFVLFKPKDIVSGDFYWFETTKDKVLFAAVDCTGHGVPGAFMSLVGANALNQAVREHQQHVPARILDDLNQLASETLNKSSEDNSVRDGMDVALCAIDKDKMLLEYAGANNPLYIVRNGEILETKADKFAIGGMTGEKYTNHEIQLQEGDTIYIFSDGYADQFGGPKGKKFMYRQFRGLLQSMNGQSMKEQGKTLDDAMEKWKGTYEQVDDILVIGVKL